MAVSPANRIYPPKGRIEFDGGMVNKFQKNLIQDNSSPDCQNVLFTERAVGTRGGTDKFNSTAVGNNPFDAIYTRHDNDGSETMIVWHQGNALYGGVNTFVTIPSAQSVYTAGVRVGAVEYENYQFYGNGSSQNYKYNEDFTRHGIPAPTTTMTVATAATGTGLTADVSYKVTFVNSNLVEGDVNPVSNTLTVASQDVTITSIPVAPTSFGVNQRRLYRDDDDGGYKLVATINDNTTTTYDDTIASPTTVAPTDQGEPPSFSTAIYHKDRLFMDDPTSPNFVWYTELGNPYVVKSTSFIRIGDNSADIVKGFSVHDNSLLVFCATSTWLVYMSSTAATDWSVIKVKSSYGSESPFGVVNYNNKVLHPAMENGRFAGFATISGGSVAPSSTLLAVAAAGSDLTSNTIEPDMFKVQDGQVSNISSMVFKNRAYITVTYDTGNTTNNRMYIFDFSNSNISKTQAFAWVPWTGLNAAQFTILDGVLYYASSDTSGFVYEMNTDTFSDDGAAIDSYFWTKELSGQSGEENVFKDFRYANLLFALLGSYSMDLNFRVDSETDTGNRVAIDLTTLGSVWDTMTWDVDNWNGSAESKEVRQFLGQLRGKRIQFRFSNQNKVNQGFTVYGLNFVYNRKGRR